MIGDTALGVEDRVDSIEKLHTDPPAEWTHTAWAIVEEDGKKVLRETAIIECPNCTERAYWARGFVACAHCDSRQRLIG